MSLTAVSPFARHHEFPAEIVGRSGAIVRVQELVRRAAQATGGTIVTGEPGSDSEAVAREIHDLSVHSTGPYVIVPCDGADAATIDRVLFGDADAIAAHDLESITADSRVAAARGGTLLLQNVTELPAGPQARLARVARDGEVRIDGVVVATGVRFIATASSAIDAEVHGHRFRPDLYRRLSSARIDLPPLRERLEDLPELAMRVMQDLCAAERRLAPTFTQAALALIGALTWPGNLAELRDAMARVLADTRDEVIQIEHLLPALQLNRARAPFLPAGNLRDARQRFERDYIAAVLQHHGWRMSDAAQTLGIQRPNLYRKARQLGIPLARISE
jgi:two-component system response regulator HydG